MQCREKAIWNPPIINDKLNEMGTLMMITEIVNTSENGEMDIKTEGVNIFRILEIIKKVPDKLYSGAIVNYPENITEMPNSELMQRVLNALRQLHRLLKIEKDFKKADEQISAYDIGHHSGLSLEEEYELLTLLREDQRQEYLKRHLARVLPVIAEMETLKKRVKLNGHFKNLSSFDFEQ